MMQHSSQTGFSLVEALVAITVLLIAIVGPLTIVSRSLEGAIYAREQATASFLAQEGLELVHKIRDEAGLESINPSGSNPPAWDWTTSGDWDECFDPNGCGLYMLDGGSVSSPIACGSDGSGCALKLQSSGRSRYYHNINDSNTTPYTRVIRLTPVGGGVNGVEVRSEVTWATGLTGSNQTTVVTGYLYDIHD